MHETSAGLGFLQVMMTLVLAALVIWLALVLGLVAAAAWAIFHVISTQLVAARARTASRTISSMAQTPPPSPAYPTLAQGQPPASPAYPTLTQGQPPASPASVTTPPPAQGEPTSWLAVGAVALLLAAGIPVAAGVGGWLSIVAGLLAASLALAAHRSAVTTLTTVVTRGVAVVAVGVVVLSGLLAYTNRSQPMYADPAASVGGTMSTIAEATAALPCIDEPRVPGDASQESFTLGDAPFVATASCTISLDDDAEPVLFVQADSPEALQGAFVAGVLDVRVSDERRVSLAVDGAVAVIAADSESADLARAALHGRLQLSDEPYGR